MKTQEFMACFSNEGKATSKEFIKLLDATDEKGVNDFSVPFHRTPFDYCSGYYVIIKVDGLYNLIYYDWSQYSGYHYQIISKQWFEKIFIEEGCIYGTSESYRYGHIEYDYNASRGVSHPIPSILKVKSEKGYNFICLQSYGMKDCLIIDKWFDSVTPWERGERYDIKNCKVTIGDKTYRLTSSGGLTDTTRWSYKGAGYRIITKEEALEKIKHHSFGMGFYTMDFEISSSLGDVVLVFNELSENDMW